MKKGARASPAQGRRPLRLGHELADPEDDDGGTAEERDPGLEWKGAKAVDYSDDDEGLEHSMTGLMSPKVERRGFYGTCRGWRRSWASARWLP